MVDLACSVALLGLIALAALAYGAHALLHGRARYRRVERDGGSALFNQGAMSAGYWALQPLGDALGRLGVTPNMISLAGLALGLAAAVALGLGHFGVASVLVVVASVSDALDGMVARATGVASDSGEALDASADRYQEFAFLAAVTVHYRADVGWMLLALAALLGSVMTSYVTAKAEALGVEVPRGSMRRPERALYLSFGALLTPIAAALFAGRAPWITQSPMLAALAVVALVANVSAVRRLRALMNTLDARRPPSKPARRDSLGRTLGRHQLGSVAATLVDFGTLAALVELAGVSPVAGTALGALAGAVTNFTLARRWIFRDHAGTAAAQALRYAVVSGASLGLNTLGEYLLVTRLGGHYLAARVVVAVAVSLLWNFPMHRRFVFPRAAEAT
ncbi:MAG: CDP-diacylglycerol--glycerol-3-phosphate 3-phosphatidyltransferase [Myxococcaceae bacterium]|nr:CDP-diacylglycerol--glycerol-3-phosphate 3-phosphatidyltransferase [Myxococcaceae bacterium]